MKSSSVKNLRQQASLVQGTVPEKQESPAVADRAALEESILHEATGSRNRDAATRLLFQARSALKLGLKNHNAPLTDAFAMMKEIGPGNSLESLLAIQMLAVHEATLVFLMNGAKDGQNLDVAYGCINRATSLLRVFIQQLETLQKLKGKTGQQKVTVKHVHVHQGGQAIVGTVTREDPKMGEGGGDD